MRTTERPITAWIWICRVNPTTKRMRNTVLATKLLQLLCSTSLIQNTGIRSTPIHSLYSIPTITLTTTAMTTIASPRLIITRFRRRCLLSLSNKSTMVATSILSKRTSMNSASSSLKSPSMSMKLPTIHSMAASRATCIATTVLLWNQESLQSTSRRSAYIPMVATTGPHTNTQTSTIRLSTGWSLFYRLMILNQRSSTNTMHKCPSQSATTSFSDVTGSQHLAVCYQSTYLSF